MMLPHELHDNKAFHMDDDLYNNLIEVPKRIKKNKDALILIVGKPGDGKSTIGSQIGYLFNNNIINENCFFSTIDDYIKYQVKIAENKESRGKVIIHDEARETGGLNILNKEVKRFWDIIYENRYLNTYQILIQSDFFRIPRDIIFARALFLIWVVEQEDWSNGVFYFFSRKQMIRLYDEAKRNYNYNPRYWNFQGRFVSFFAGNPNYLKEKNNNFINKFKNNKEEKNNNNRDYYIYKGNEVGITRKVLSLQFNLSLERINKIIQAQARLQGNKL